MNKIFLDSSIFKAIIDSHDDFHTQATSLWKEFILSNIPLITTNYILDETFTLIRIKCNLKRAIELRNFLSRPKVNIYIERVTIDDDASAWDWFIKDWSKLSFTDCVSFAVMKRLGIKYAATFDDHFSKAGFEIVK